MTICCSSIFWSETHNPLTCWRPCVFFARATYSVASRTNLFCNSAQVLSSLYPCTSCKIVFVSQQKTSCTMFPYWAICRLYPTAVGIWTSDAGYCPWFGCVCMHVSARKHERGFFASLSHDRMDLWVCESFNHGPLPTRPFFFFFFFSPLLPSNGSLCLRMTLNRNETDRRRV